jgi:hypothetical protein
LASGAASSPPPAAPEIPVVADGRLVAHRSELPVSGGPSPLPWVPRGPPS